jgi:hypothetical protein
LLSKKRERDHRTGERKQKESSFFCKNRLFVSEIL